MPVQILMPALSPTMTEGNLAKWLKKEGDAVKSGDILCEIETDKATMEYEAVDEGVLGKILVAGGTSGVAVNTPIAVLLEEGEDASALSPLRPPRLPRLRQLLPRLRPLLLRRPLPSLPMLPVTGLSLRRWPSALPRTVMWI